MNERDPSLLQRSRPGGAESDSGRSRTFGMIKPDAVRDGKAGEIIGHILQRDLRVVAARTMVLTREQARWLYSHCEGRDYYEAQIEHMLSGPVIALVLEAATERQDAVSHYRAILGDTNPSRAHPDTIRGRYGSATVRRENAAHGSDTPEAARREIAHFFPEI